jgi:pimeloyl-ACP methyl ester carboxylesterase
LHAQLWVQSEVSRRWPAWAFNAAIKRLPAADVAILTRPSIRRLMELEAAHASRTVAQAQAQDIELFVADWGFDLGSITAPVHVWQGDADSVVPPIHATVLHEAIPGSQLHTVAGGGHFMAVDHLGEIVAGL